MGRAFEFRKERKFKRWAKMSKVFTKLGKEIVMAVKAGGPDPDSNAKLRTIIQNAKGAQMTKDRIEAAIKRATNKDEKDYEEIVYEGYGPHGIAVIVETSTDNTNRTVANVRSYFTKYCVLSIQMSAICRIKHNRSEERFRRNAETGCISRMPSSA